jgi:hypothetical protein
MNYALNDITIHKMIHPDYDDAYINQEFPILLTDGLIISHLPINSVF